MDTISKDLYKYVFKIANKQIKINNNDTIIDGMLKCHKCGDFKQKKIYINNESLIIPNLCKCEQKKYDEEKLKILNKKKQDKILFLKTQAFKNKNYYFYTLKKADLDNKYMLHVINKYIENWNECKNNGIGLFLYGNVGVGKTFYACCIANELLEHEISVIFISIFELVNQISLNYGANKENILNKLKKIDLIIIDDFQLKENNEYEIDIIYEIINTLYENSKPVIITTNLDINDLKSNKIQYQKIYDRIAQMCSAVLVESNINKRRIKSLKRKEIIQKIIKRK